MFRFLDFKTHLNPYLAGEELNVQSDFAAKRKLILLKFILQNFNCNPEN